MAGDLRHAMMLIVLTVMLVQYNIFQYDIVVE